MAIEVQDAVSNEVLPPNGPVHPEENEIEMPGAMGES